MSTHHQQRRVPGSSSRGVVAKEIIIFIQFLHFTILERVVLLTLSLPVARCCSVLSDIFYILKHSNYRTDSWMDDIYTQKCYEWIELMARFSAWTYFFAAVSVLPFVSVTLMPSTAFLSGDVIHGGKKKSESLKWYWKNWGWSWLGV